MVAAALAASLLATLPAGAAPLKTPPKKGTTSAIRELQSKRDQIRSQKAKTAQHFANSSASGVGCWWRCLSGPSLISCGL